MAHISRAELPVVPRYCLSIYKTHKCNISINSATTRLLYILSYYFESINSNKSSSLYCWESINVKQCISMEEQE